MATDQFYVLTEADRNHLRALFEVTRTFPSNIPPGNTTQRPIGATYADDPQTPEVYVVRTPPSGIPPALESAGTSTASIEEPGYAVCDVLRLLQLGTAGTGHDFQLLKAGFKKLVFNLSTSTVAGDTWVLAVKDKYGDYYAIPTAVGGGGALEVELDDHSVQIFGVTDLQFKHQDFVLSGTSPTALAGTKGLSITVQYCDADGTIHSLVYVDGLLQSRT